MGVVNSKMGVTAKIFARAPRAVSFMLTYPEISAGALVCYASRNILSKKCFTQKRCGDQRHA